MDKDSATAKQFVDDAVLITQQLDAVIGKPLRPERPLVIRRAQTVYNDLVSRRASLTVSPMAEWAIDLLMDGIKTRLEILAESSAEKRAPAKAGTRARVSTN